MAFLKARQRELLVLALILAVIWVRQLMVGEMNDEIAKLAMGLPAKRTLLAKVKQAEVDAKDVAHRLDEIRRQPLPGVNLASTLERFHTQRNLPAGRARLTPKPQSQLEGQITEESVDVMVTSMTLDEVVEYLSALEALGPSLRVRVLRMTKTQDTLSLNLTVSALRPQ